MERLALTLPATRFEDPVWLDLLTGNVCEIDAALCQAKGDGTVFPRLPYDSPIVITDRGVIADVLQPKAPASP
jgi:hypothetical protein